MEINLVAVGLSALSAFFLGFLWYTVIFAKPWQKEIGMADHTANGETPNLGKQLVGSFILELLMAFGLAYFFIPTTADAMFGLKTGAIVGFAFVGFAFGVNYFFEGKTFTHWLINAGYNTVVFALMGLIIGAL